MAALLRVFAGEFALSEHVPAGPGRYVRVITPTGATGGHLFICGVLTEVSGTTHREMTMGRVADPSGVFVVQAVREHDRSLLAGMEIPSYLSVCGRIRMVGAGTSASATSPMVIEPDSVVSVNREIRDSWVIMTAALTMDRIRGQTTMNDTIRRNLINLVNGALRTVRAIPGQNAAGEGNPGIVLSLIRTHGGPRGIAVADLLPLAAREGISEAETLRAVRQLIEEDELYQPSAGMVKVL
jgi:RPA family protein